MSYLYDSLLSGDCVRCEYLYRLLTTPYQYICNILRTLGSGNKSKIMPFKIYMQLSLMNARRPSVLGLSDVPVAHASKYCQCMVRFMCSSSQWCPVAGQEAKCVNGNTINYI